MFKGVKVERHRWWRGGYNRTQRLEERMFEIFIANCLQCSQVSLGVTSTGSVWVFRLQLPELNVSIPLLNQSVTFMSTGASEWKLPRKSRSRGHFIPVCTVLTPPGCAVQKH